MTIARAALLVLLVLPSACREAVPPVTAKHRAELELEVYRALLAKDHVAGANIRSEINFQGPCLPEPTTTPCWTGRVPRASAAALTEYLAINDTSHSIDPALLDTLRAAQRGSTSPAMTGPDGEPAEIFLSRVGFGARGRTAVASIARRSSHGPRSSSVVRTRTYLLVETFGHFAVLTILENTTT